MPKLAGLGDLIREMQELFARDPNVLKPKDKVPKTSKANYIRYQACIEEINNREMGYNGLEEKVPW
ncbi:hypothetical protein HY212_06695 [Candidatus Pacearchaeota archaeon]|nr:hypothetical protein [Candidatus Pacearchaeota archaeon]